MTKKTIPKKATDTLNSAQRSERMRLIKSKNTKPEGIVKKLISSLKIRFTRNVGTLPGSPDFVFKQRKKVIFVHGCFWHRHEAKNCKLSRLPKSKLEYWQPKFDRNKARDIENLIALKKSGWNVLTLWECELKNTDRVSSRISRFLRQN